MILNIKPQITYNIHVCSSKKAFSLKNNNKETKSMKNDVENWRIIYF